MSARDNRLFDTLANLVEQASPPGAINPAHAELLGQILDGWRKSKSARPAREIAEDILRLLVRTYGPAR